jgi:hypothetical protein
MEIYVIPTFFHGVDVAFEVIFALVCILIAIKSFAIFDLSKQKESKLFGIGFLLMAISYICQLLFNLTAYSFSSFFGLILLFAHVLLGLSALVVLAYTFSHVKSTQMLLLLILVMIVSVVFSVTILFQFYVIGAIFFAYIVFQCILAYIKFQKSRIMLTALGFCFLVLAQIMSAFSFESAACYIYSHILSLVGYVILLVNLLLVRRHEKKTRSP